MEAVCSMLRPAERLAAPPLALALKLTKPLAHARPPP
jgi:hypothetical protein